MAVIAEIQLPWPPAELSPNARQHWGKLHNARKRYRTICLRLAEEQVRWEASFTGSLGLTAIFHPPSRRRFDLDNMYARMKSGIDGLCDSLGIDDHQIKETLLRLAETRVDGSVTIQLRTL